MDGTNELFQRRDPVVILVRAVFGAGDQPAIRRIGVVGKLVVDHAPCGEVEPVPVQQAREHGVVIAQFAQHDIGGVAGLKDADLHGVSII